MALNNPFVIRTFNRAKSRILLVARKISEHRGVSLVVLLALLVAGVIAPLVGQEEARRGKKENERDSAALIRKRAEWFFHQRAFPLGHIPAGARLKAIQQMEEMRRTQGTLMDRFAAQARTAGTPEGMIGSLSGTAWTSVGPQPTSSVFFGLTSGRVNAIAVDPCDTTGNTVYIGGAQGGVWKTTDGGTNWTPLTDNQPSLAIGSLALDSNTSDCTAGHTGAIYAGTGEENFSFDSFYGAGVLISHDGGATWTKDTTFAPVTGGIITPPQGSQFAGPFIGSLSVQPGSSGATQVLLAGIQGVSTTVHSGVYRSVDGGSTWTPVLPTGGSADFGTSVAFDPSTGQTAYAALGVPFCTNGPASCGTGEEANNGLYKSIDGGQTWTRLQSLDNAANSALGTGASSAYGRITIAVAPTSTGTEIVAAIADINTSSSNLLGDTVNTPVIFISTDAGTSFSSQLATISGPGGFCDAQCFYDISVGLDPNPSNPSTPFLFLGGGPTAGGASSPLAGASSVIFSSNGGHNFTDVSLINSTTTIHVDNHAFAFAHPTSGANTGQTIVYIGDDGGVWSSSNVESIPGSQTWNNLNNNLSLTQLYPGNSIHPSNPQLALGGSQDNGTQKFDPTFNPSNQQEWHDTAACGDGGWTAIDPSTPSTVYAACEAIGNLGTINKNQLDGEPGGVSGTSTFGQNWIAVDAPGIDSDAAISTNFVPPLVLDPLTPQNLYFGTFRLWQSTTGGISWTPISGDLTGVTSGSNPNCGGTTCVITTMAVTPTDSNTVYVGTDLGQIWATSTANLGSGATFAEINNSSTPVRTVTQIVGSPASNKVAYISFSGFSTCSGCDGKGHIFKFDGTVGNGSFTNLTGNLPDIPVNDIVLDPNDNTNNTIYVATDVGVFATTNGGSTWLPLATGLPHIECTSLKLNNAARVLIVGTHGRGDWELQLPGLAADALTGISPTSMTAGASGFTLTLNGQGFGTNPTVNFGTTPLTSTGSGAQLTVAVPSSALTSSGVEAVTVAGASGSLNFSIEGPVPVLNSTVSPSSVASTANAVTITVTGQNFMPNTGLTWTPGLGSSQLGNTTLLAQQPGGTSTSFTVSVPATLLQSTLSHIVPVAPKRPTWPGTRFWLLAAAFAAVLGILLFAFVRQKRRLVFGTTIATVVVLLSIAGCGGSNNNPRPGSVTVALNAYTPGPGGGLSTTTDSFIVQ